MHVHFRRWLRTGVLCIALTGVASLATPPAQAAARAATLPSPQTSPAESARLARGRQIRSFVLKLLEQIDTDRGKWPEKLASPEAERLSLLYSKPQNLGEPGLLYQQQVVVNESPEKYPDGVWVGYADGHVEFARTLADLASCKDQLRIIRESAGSYKNTWGPDPNVDPKSVAGKLGGSLTLTVIDPQGRPAAGVLVGIRSEMGDDIDADHFVYFDGEPKVVQKVTNSAGQVVLPAKLVFDPTGQGSFALDFGAAPIVVMDKPRRLAALDEVPFSQFSGGKTRTIQLQPACHITGTLTSFGLEEMGEGLGHSEGYAAIPGKVLIRALFFASERGQIDMLVPPGEYRICINLHHCYVVTRYVRVGPSDRNIALNVDMPARRLPEQLIGQSAPELRGIKAWKNGGPVTLGDLRGKVVILDFWGYGCGVCTYGSMPELMKLWDRYNDKGLVIIAVHDDSVASIAEMDQKLQTVRKEAWNGRDLPFLVALDGGGPTRIPGTGAYSRGITDAEYRAYFYPTTYLIGPDGTVLQEISDISYPRRRAEVEKTIEQLLNRLK